MSEVSRNRISETIEEVVYNKQKIKHFDRNGSEYWAEVSVPDIHEKQVEVDRIEYRCDQCNETKMINEEIE